MKETPTAEEGPRLGLLRMLSAYLCGSYAFGLQGAVTLLVPLLAHEAGMSLMVIGVVVGAGGLGPALVSVPLGAFIDRAGPRRSFMLASVVIGVTAALFMLPPAVWSLIVLQIILGIARSLAWVGAQTYIAGLGTSAQQPTIAGRFSFFSNLGMFAAPLLVGSAAQVVGYRGAFGVVVAISALFVGISSFLVNFETRARPGVQAQSRSGFGGAARLLTLPAMQVVLLLTFARLWISAGWSAFFPLFLASKGFQPAIIGVIISSNSAVATLTTLAAGPLAYRFRKDLLAIFALGISSLGALLSPHVATIPLVFLATGLLGLGSGISLPLLIAILRDSVGAHERGLALGLRMTANQLAVIAIPVVLGWAIPPLGMFLGFALIGVGSWSFEGGALWLTLRRRARKDESWRGSGSAPAEVT